MLCVFYTTYTRMATCKHMSQKLYNSVCCSVVPVGGMKLSTCKYELHASTVME